MLLSRFVADGHQTLAFTRSRKGAELVATHARGMLAEHRAPDSSPSQSPAVAAYRAGYLADERRELEAQLAGGELGGVVATSALELGIDVGSLDAVVLNGFPGTLSSMRQQVGRAGRTTRRAAAVLVAGDDQLDQWYARHPDELLDAPGRSRGREPRQPVRRPGADLLRRARAPPHPRGRALLRRRARRRGARPRGRRPAQAPRRPDVLGRPRATRGARRAADRVLARGPAGRHRRTTRGHGRRGTCVPRRPPRCHLPAPGPPVPGARPGGRTPGRGARARRRRRRAHPTARGDRHRGDRRRSGRCRSATARRTSVR